MKNKNLDFCNRLKLARENSGLSQEQVARILKIHRPSISEIEAGRRKVSSEELDTLSEIYSVSVEWLLKGEGVSDIDDRVFLAARELAKLKKDDLNAVIRLLSTLRKSK